MDEPVEPAVTTKTNAVVQPRSGVDWKVQFRILCVMLVLALGGMGLTQASEGGAWGYWLFVVVVYAMLGAWWTARRAKQNDEPARGQIAREIGHWVVLLGFQFILVMLVRGEIIDRESASDSALMLLALSCCLAGIHFDWHLMIVGIVLTVMLVAMATLEQYMIVLWVVMILVVVGAAAVFYFRSGREGSVGEAID